MDITDITDTMEEEGDGSEEMVVEVDGEAVMEVEEEEEEEEVMAAVVEVVDVSWGGEYVALRGQ